MIGSDEGDGLDVGVVADEVDGVVGSVNDVDDAVRCAGFAQHVDEHHAGAGISLRGLDDVRVSASQGNWEHLQVEKSR